MVAVWQTAEDRLRAKSYRRRQGDTYNNTSRAQHSMYGAESVGRLPMSGCLHAAPQPKRDIQTIGIEALTKGFKAQALCAASIASCGQAKLPDAACQVWAA